MTDLRVSVVVPCRGHARELQGCLASLEGHKPPHEIIVVDAAEDPEVARVAARPAVRLVRSRDGLLPAAARNLGVRESRGAVLVFIDADCTAEPGWLAAAEAGLSTGARLVGGPVLDARPFHPVAVADNLLQFADFTAGRADGPASYFPACNLAMPRGTFDALGGFPPLPFAAGEDTALCDLALARWPDGLRYVNAMRVRHLGRSSPSVLWRHHRGFGRIRGLLGLRLKPAQQRLARSAWWTGPVALKRMAYITRTVARHEPMRLPALALLLPLLGFGLLGWAVGFREGCRAAADSEGA